MANFRLIHTGINAFIQGFRLTGNLGVGLIPYSLFHSLNVIQIYKYTCHKLPSLSLNADYETSVQGVQGVPGRGMLHSF